jgi:hypothetical protein
MNQSKQAARTLPAPPSAIRPTPKFVRRVMFASVLMVTWIFVGGIALALANDSRDPNEAASPVAPSQKESPSSERFFTLKLTFESGLVFEATQAEGKSIQVRHLDGALYHIRAVKQQDRVEAKVSRSIRMENKGDLLAEITEDVDLFEIAATGSVLRTSDLAVRIELVSFSSESKQTSGSLSVGGTGLNDDGYEWGGGGSCCLSCGGEYVCACRVTGICGTCCVGTCCT